MTSTFASEQLRVKSQIWNMPTDHENCSLVHSTTEPQCPFNHRATMSIQSWSHHVHSTKEPPCPFNHTATVSIQPRNHHVHSIMRPPCPFNQRAPMFIHPWSHHNLTMEQPMCVLITSIMQWSKEKTILCTCPLLLLLL